MLLQNLHREEVVLIPTLHGHLPGRPFSITGHYCTTCIDAALLKKNDDFLSFLLRQARLKFLLHATSQEQHETDEPSIVFHTESVVSQLGKELENWKSIQKTRTLAALNLDLGAQHFG